MKLHKILITTISIIFLIFSIIPAIYFVSNFKSANISEQISDWGAFGDYFGGTINTIISLFSLIILGYLTFLVSEQSNKENKKINILLRRLDAYDKLSSYFPEINRFISRIYRTVTILNDKIEKNIEDQNSITEVKKELYKKIDFFSEFYHFLFAFNLRYGHLFEYDFNSIFYRNLVENAKLVNDHFKSVEATFELGKDNYVPYNHELTIKLFDDLVIFVDSLRKELE